MENKEQPAYPVDTDKVNIPREYSTGLTKRELIAAMFTAAFIQCPQNGNPLMIEENAKHGIAQADIFLTQLES